MREDETVDLKARIARMSDEDLLRMANQDAADYRAEALGFARSELMRRGFALSDLGVIANQSAGRPRDLADLRCDACGGQLRPGWLFAKRETTVIFSDNNEERFVEALACVACGRIRLLADLETQVDEGFSVRYV